MGQFVRLVVIFLVIWVAVSLLKRALGANKTRKSRRPTADLPRMLPCAYCGVHVPESEVISRAEKVYCCEDHRRREEIGH
jgi:uncharacterized protein